MLIFVVREKEILISVACASLFSAREPCKRAPLYDRLYMRAITVIIAIECS